MRRRSFMGLSGSLALASPSSRAEAWPTRPITIVVPFSAGGPTDTIARVIGEGLQAALGQNVIIDNVAGAAGTIGVGKVARAAPDGYTLSIGHWGTHVANGAIYKLPYDLVADFAPVAWLANGTPLIVSRNSVPAGNLGELIGWLKANPGKGLQGTAGVGSPQHLGGLYFQEATGTQFQFVPYRGVAPAMQDLLAGNIDFMIDQATNSLPQVRAGKIRAYAACAAHRLAAAPDVPSVDEAGLPGFYISIWQSLWAPKGTPREIIVRLNAAVVDSLRSPAVIKRFADITQEIPAADRMTPEALASLQRDEIAKWWPMIKAAGIKPE